MITGRWSGLWGVVLLASGCVQSDGGAVELRWIVLDEAQGKAQRACRCADGSAAIERMEVSLLPREGAAPLERSFSFPCTRGRGTTSFDVAPGRYDVKLIPRDATGRNLNEPPIIAYPVPPSVARDVVDGQITDLEAWSVTVRCAN